MTYVIERVLKEKIGKGISWKAITSPFFVLLKEVKSELAVAAVSKKLPFRYD